MTKADLERIFGDMDKDGSNEVTKEEFMSGMKGNYVGRKKPSVQSSLNMS